MADLATQVQQALARFFDPSTSTAEKRQLEAQLHEFKARGEALESACQFLQAAARGDETLAVHVLWFSASILEDTVRLRWSLLDASSRAELRGFVFQLVLGEESQSARLPRLVVGKLVETCVLIGRIDWPDDFPTFFDDVLGAAAGPAGYQSQRGLDVLAGVLQEGMLAPDARRAAVVPAAKAAQFRAEVGRRVPAVVGVLGAQLEAVCRAAGASGGGAAGPTGPAPGSDPFVMGEATLRVLREVASGANLHDQLDGRLLEGLFQCSTWRESDLATLALQCIAELMGKPCVPLQLEDALVQVASRFVGDALLPTASLLAAAAAEGPDAVEAAADGLAEGFLEAVADGVRALLDHHLRRLERHGGGGGGGGAGGASAGDGGAVFPMNEFLEGFFSWTLNQPTAQAFMDCLSMWEILVSHVSSTVHRQQHEQPAPLAGGSAAGAEHPHLALYFACLGQLALTLVQRTQFSASAALLAQLDDSDIADRGGAHAASAAAAGLGFGGDDSDDDDDDFAASGTSGGGGGRGSAGGRAGLDGGDGDDAGSYSTSGGSELEQYLDACVRLVTNIGRIGGQVAQALVEALCPALQSSLERFQGGLATGSDGAALRGAVRDLSTCLRLLGAMVGHFLYGADGELALGLVRSAIETGTAVASQRLYTRGNDFTTLLVTTCDTVGRFAPWIQALATSRYASASGIAVGPTQEEAAASRAKAVAVLDRTADLIVATLDAMIVPPPEILMVAAARLLGALTSRVLPPSADDEDSADGSAAYLCLTDISEKTTKIVAEIGPVGAALPLAVQQRLHTAAVRGILLLAAPSAAGLLQGTDVGSTKARVDALLRIVTPLTTRLAAIAQQGAGAGGGQAGMGAGAGAGGGSELDASAMRAIAQSAGLLSSVVRTARNASRDLKLVVWDAVCPGLEPAIALVAMVLSSGGGGAAAASGMAGQRAAACALLDLVLHAVDALRRQMGQERITQTVSFVLELFQSFLAADSSASSAPPSSSSAHTMRKALLVRKLLTLLRLVVSEPTKAFKALIPNILSLCVDHILQLAMAAATAPGSGAAGGAAGGDSAAVEHLVDPSMVSLVLVIFREAVLQHPAFFFASRAAPASTASPGAHAGFQRDLASPEAARYLGACLTLCLRLLTLSTTPPRLVAGALNLMVEVQRRNRALTLPALTAGPGLDGPGDMRITTAVIVDALLRTLVSGEHAIVHEDLIALVYEIAATDTDAFFGHLLPQTLKAGFQQLAPEQHVALRDRLYEGGTDAPSFSRGLQSFAADCRYYVTLADSS